MTYLFLTTHVCIYISRVTNWTLNESSGQKLDLSVRGDHTSDNPIPIHMDPNYIDLIKMLTASFPR